MYSSTTLVYHTTGGAGYNIWKMVVYKEQWGQNRQGTITVFSMVKNHIIGTLSQMLIHVIIGVFGMGLKNINFLRSLNVPLMRIDHETFRDRRVILGCFHPIF